MDNNTVNENWIDKLIDELIDAKDKVNSLTVDSSQLDVLVSIILDGSMLDYDGKGLRIADESGIFAYLRAIYPACYNERLRELKEESEAARDKERLKEVAATEEA